MDGWILMKFAKNVNNATRNRLLSFGGDLNYILDREFFDKFVRIACTIMDVLYLTRGPHSHSAHVYTGKRNFYFI